MIRSQTAGLAFALVVLVPRGILSSDDAASAEALRAVTRMITASENLLLRERQIFDRHTADLAALLAIEPGALDDDVEPWVIANALIGIHRALLACVRGQAMAGEAPAAIRTGFRLRGERALATLARGLALASDQR